MSPMRAMLDILRGLVLAILVFQAAAPAMADPGGGPAPVSCLGAVAPGQEGGEDQSLHAACWACCTAPAIIRPVPTPALRTPPRAAPRAAVFAAEAPRRALVARPPARGPPALI